VAGKGASLFAFLLVLIAPSASRAEHEVYYRYTVLGYVGDESGRPRPGVEVELVREKTGFSYLGRTDDTGLYVIVARLGDESAGEQLRLRAAGQTATVTARFDPADHARERGTRVDFIRGTRVETPADFTTTLQRFLAQ
jgi:hypothetical protein